MKRLKCGRVFLVILIFPVFLMQEISFGKEEQSNPDKELTVFYAAGLNTALQEIIKEFKKLHPSTKIIAESSGSLLAVRKVTELKRDADLLLLADELVIQNMLIPEYTDWYIRFYNDAIVLAYTDKSKYTNEINAQNWYKLLLRKDVRYGYADPNLAPIGYRTLMCWQLADLYYKDKIDGQGIYGALRAACPKGQIVADVAEMLYMLESLYLDYGFIYMSTAKQHNLKYIQLPKEIDLSAPELVSLYQQAKVEISTQPAIIQTMLGGPITFALTILKDASNFETALEFVKFLLGPTGREILESNSQMPMRPYQAYNPHKLPAELGRLVSETTP